MRNKITIICLFFICMFVPVSCAHASASPEPTNQTIPKELKMGRKVAESVEENMPRLLDRKEEDRLAAITAKLTPYMQRKLHYEVRILKLDDQLNAFSLPGGYTYITTGMLKALKSDDEIAAVLAHEFVHADRAHVLVQTAKNSKLNAVTIAGILAAVAGAGPGALVMAGALQTAVTNAYTIELEKEADARGIEALWNAGYNPTAMLILMDVLKEETIRSRSYADLGIYQTHPEDEERLNAAVDFMKLHNIPIERKKLQSVLNFTVLESAELQQVYLNVDGVNILTLPYTEANLLFLQRLRWEFEQYVELELAPYDFYIMDTAYGKSLVIKGVPLVYAKDMPKGSPSLQAVRDTVNGHIVRLRRRNPFTNYFL